MIEGADTPKRLIGEQGNSIPFQQLPEQPDNSSPVNYATYEITAPGGGPEEPQPDQGDTRDAEAMQARHEALHRYLPGVTYPAEVSPSSTEPPAASAAEQLAAIAGRESTAEPITVRTGPRAGEWRTDTFDSPADLQRAVNALSKNPDYLEAYSPRYAVEMAMELYILATTQDADVHVSLPPEAAPFLEEVLRAQVDRLLAERRPQAVDPASPIPDALPDALPPEIP